MKLYTEYSKELLERPEVNQQDLKGTVEKVFNDISLKGDSALIEYTEKFDGVKMEGLRVSEEEMQSAVAQIDEKLKNAIELAANNIELFHKSQVIDEDIVQTSMGVSCWREARPIQKVGLYIPGGTAPLFSTVLMLGIPAKIAGCQEVVLCSPPNKEGKLHPAILYAAHVCGIKDIFKVGGIQAIAGMTVGTESIPNVYKLFGPGNQYVTAAKQFAQNHKVAIDMPAGPSELLVYSDEEGEPEFIAADLLSQAEHGVDSQVIFVTNTKPFAEKVIAEVEKQLETLPRKQIAKEAIANSRVLVIEDEAEAIDVINEYGPEHLIITCANEGKFIHGVQNAGSVFLGKYTPESAGDYASGTNHTLPTNGFAKNYSGVSLDSFVKKITFQRISADGIQHIGPSIEVMAQEESLDAHKMAVTYRLKSLNNEN